MVCSVISLYFDSPLISIQQKQTVKNFTLLIQRYTFDFLDKCLGIVSAAHFVYDFLTKIFLILYLLTDQTSWPGCLFFLRYWTICVLQLFVNQVVTSWILKLTLSFQSSRFFQMTKNSWQKLKYLENEKIF